MAGTYLGQPECSQNSCVPQGPSFDLTLAGVQVFPNTDAPALLESLTHSVCALKLGQAWSLREFGHSSSARATAAFGQEAFTERLHVPGPSLGALSLSLGPHRNHGGGRWKLREVN